MEKQGCRDLAGDASFEVQEVDQLEKSWIPSRGAELESFALYHLCRACFMSACLPKWWNGENVLGEISFEFRFTLLLI